MNALIVSLNFNPGHFSHLVATYKLLTECGIEPCLYVAPAFNDMDKSNAWRKVNSLRSIDPKKRIHFAVFWFPSLRNLPEIIRLKMRFRTKIIYVLHEPPDSFQNYHEGGFSIGQILKIYLVSLVNMATVAVSSCVVLPSRKACSVYKNKYALLNSKFFLIPLLFDDESSTEPDITTKQYISYIGTIGGDHAFDMFIRFIEASIREDWFPECNFLVATRSTIPPATKELIRTLASSNRIRVVEDRPLSNEEINTYFRDSCVVWNAYNRSMQSGVLAKAFMFGAPVLVLARNANEFVINRKTAILIDDNRDLLQIRDAIVEMRRNLSYYCRNCRETFLGTFHYKSHLDDFKRVLGI